MSRDHRKLQVFELADSLVPAIYRYSRDFPDGERYGLQAQLRRAAVSVATNIVEGSARRGQAEYVSFLNVAVGSAAEAQYLVQLAARLELVAKGEEGELVESYDRLLRGLKALINRLDV